MRKQGIREANAMEMARKRLTDLVLFKNAGFTLTPGSISSNADTDKIKEATDLYMRSWVIPLIEAVTSGDVDKVSKLVY